MRSLRLSFLIFLFFACITHSTTLQERWEQEKARPSRSQILKDKHVLFVAGIMNELADIISNYYPSNIEAVGELGATASYLKPTSKISIPENSEILHRKIIKLSQSEKKPITIIAHSKGGAEVLYMILMHPELMLNGSIENVYLIQAAIGGSPLADASSWCLDLVCAMLHPNLQTLKPAEAKINFNKAFQYLDVHVSQEQKAELSRRIFYVRSQEDRQHLSFGIKLVLDVLSENLKSYGPNDGLILVEDQMDTRIGTDLGILRSDHIGLTVSTVSNISHEDRKAFTRAIFINDPEARG